MNIIFTRYSHRHLLSGEESIKAHRKGTVCFGWHETTKESYGTTNNNENRAEMTYFPLTKLLFLRKSIRNLSDVSMEFVLLGSVPDLGKSFKPSLIALSTSVFQWPMKNFETKPKLKWTNKKMELKIIHFRVTCGLNGIKSLYNSSA